ncbi:MAG: Uncharacterised protein [Polaribacter sp. SA4-10]|nr:MAG: Uncharacterised protein [Polaribacter sp. SA4-10]
MKKLLFILLFTPLILFSQENVLNIETIKDEYIEEIYGITYYMGKPYNGVFYRNFENGQLKYKSNYKDGKRSGLEEEYYESGQLEYKTIYKDGKENGLYEKYYENGKLEHKANYKDGKKNGFSERYFEMISYNSKQTTKTVSKMVYLNGIGVTVS